MQFRMHLLGLPNAPVSTKYSLDGFAQATHRFARMMKDLGHTVFLYAAEGSDAPCDEMIEVISEQDRLSLLRGCEYQHALMDERKPLWQSSNARIAAEIERRKKPKDFLLTIGGASQKPVFDFHPDLLGVEYSIGYGGNFCDNRVFESYAWMHYCYGQQQMESGRFYDTVIPVFFDQDEFEFVEKPDDYFLYVGRMVESKGVRIACQAATKAGVKLYLAGHAENSDKSLVTGEHTFLGAVDKQERNYLLAHAKAVFTPTTYIEPFNCVAVEAQMCGTPVISTDYGGFTETVEHNISGFRCSLLGDFVSAIKNVEFLDRQCIRSRAIAKYSMHVLKHDYQRYFERLYTRWDEGWNTVEPDANQ